MDDKLLNDLEILAGLMEQGGWKGLLVNSDDLCVNLSQTPGEVPGQRAAVRETAPAPLKTDAAPNEAAPIADAVVDIDPDWAVVTAPNLGTFYRSPKPGLPAFVEVGQNVAGGAELCLIEVMKLFTSVRSDQAGTIRHIAAADAELVEGGQPLMYIELE